ncbi:MAG: hypothetical protein HQK53_02620 [Oligoflexia bacterium]|nr:hypothetical protein [Oligoflexia bacterium]
MNNKSTTLKETIHQSWDKIKVRYPMVIDETPVKGDPVKTEFLRYIDGLKNVEEISHYFTLEPGEAHLIFSDLIAIKAIRFIDDFERLVFLKRRNSELKGNYDFLVAEQNKLSGEKYYLCKQIAAREKEMLSITEAIPGLEQKLQEFNNELDILKSSSSELWNYNSELLGLFKDMSSKEQEINGLLEEIESAYPKAIKKKKRMSKLLQEVDERVVDANTKNLTLKRKISVYQDALSDVRECLFDANVHIKYSKNE